MNVGSPYPALAGGESISRGHPWLGAFIEAIDAPLRRRAGIIEFSRRQDCVFRLQVAPARHDATLRDGTRLCAGDPVINLHWWSEQIPPMPAAGPTLGWAHSAERAVDLSLSELARYLATSSHFGNISVICIDGNLVASYRARQFALVMARYGFEAVAMPPLRTLGEHLRRLGENLLISLIVLAYNPAGLRRDSLSRGRVLMCQSRHSLQQRYGLGRGGQ